MKSRKGSDMVKAFDEYYQQLKNAGITPILQHLDNEVSNELITTIQEKKLQYQLAFPHDHQLNPAERAIQTTKITLLPTYMAVIRDAQNISGVASFHKQS